MGGHRSAPPHEYDRVPILIPSPSLAPPQNPMFVAMGAEQREHFIEALGKSGQSGAKYNMRTIIEALANIDAGKAQCRSPADQHAIQAELAELMGRREVSCHANPNVNI